MRARYKVYSVSLLLAIIIAAVALNVGSPVPSGYALRDLQHGWIGPLSGSPRPLDDPLAQQILVTGVLTDTSDVAISTATTFNFTAYDNVTAASGNKLWTEEYSVTPDSSGRWNQTVGINATITQLRQTRNIVIYVGGEQLGALLIYPVVAALQAPNTATYVIHPKTSGLTADFYTDGTNDEIEIQWAIDNATSSGGTVFVGAGIYSASTVTVKNNVTLIIETGATGITYTVDSGATVVIEDWSDGETWYYNAGSLTARYDHASGQISDLSWLNSTSLKFTDEFWWSTENRTDVLAYPEQPASYIIFKSGSTCYAKNGSTGNIDFSGTDAGDIIKWAIGNLSSSGGSIYTREGAYTWSSQITMVDNLQLIFSEQAVITLGANFHTGADTLHGAIQAIDKENISWTGGQVNGGSTTASSGGGHIVFLWFENCSDVAVRHGTFYNFRGAAIEFRRCNRSAAEFNTFRTYTSTTGSCVLSWGDSPFESYNYGYDASSVGNKFYDVGGVGGGAMNAIYMKIIRGNSIGDEVYGVTDEGIEVEGRGIVIEGFVCDAGTRNGYVGTGGILFREAKESGAHNFWIYDYTAQGVAVHGDNPNEVIDIGPGTIIGTSSQDDGARGVLISGGEHIKVHDITSVDAARAHFETLSGGTIEDVLFEDNTAVGSSKAGGMAYRLEGGKWVRVRGGSISYTRGNGMYILTANVTVEDVDFIRVGLDTPGYYAAVQLRSADVTVKGGRMWITGKGVWVDNAGGDRLSVIDIFIEGIGGTSSKANYGVIIDNVDADGATIRRSRFRYITTAISIGAAADDTIIQQNDFDGCTTTISDSGTNTRIEGNPGYNPKGLIANPVTGSNLIDSGAGAIANNTEYTCRQSPKTIYILSVADMGNATHSFQIYVGGTAIIDTTTAPAAGIIYTVRLEYGVTFKIVYRAAPTIKVYGQ